MKVSKLVFLIVFLVGCVATQSCKECEEFLEPQANCGFSFKNFIPQNGQHEYYVEADINDVLVRYPQINFKWTNVSNKYFSQFQQTWLQAYNDSTNISGSWLLRFTNVDIENIITPYHLKDNEGTVSWYDDRLDQIIESQSICQGVDNGCTFFFTPSELGNDIIINKVDNQVIEGVFNGKLILKRVDFTPGQDTTKCYNVTHGKFKIKYQRESEILVVNCDSCAIHRLRSVP